MGKKLKRLLINKLKEKIPSNLLQLIPAHYFLIDKTVILTLHEKLIPWEKEIGNAILELFPYVRTVARKVGPFEGVKKQPQIRIIAGEEQTEIIHKENKVYFKFDFTKIEFSKGNKSERMRIAKAVKPNETLVDMFAGIGYFSIPIAVYSNVKKIYAIDINPIAIHYLKENARINKVSHKIIPILSDCRKVANELQGIADRVIMGYIPFSRNFLGAAFKFFKTKGVLHWHETFHKTELWEKPINLIKEEAEKYGYRVNSIPYKKIVKSYAPKIYHVVIDVEVEKL